MKKSDQKLLEYVDPTILEARLERCTKATDFKKLYQEYQDAKEKLGPLYDSLDTEHRELTMALASLRGDPLTAQLDKIAKAIVEAVVNS